MYTFLFHRCVFLVSFSEATRTRVRQDNNKSFIKKYFTLDSLTRTRKRSHPISLEGAERTNGQIHTHTLPKQSTRKRYKWLRIPIAMFSFPCLCGCIQGSVYLDRRASTFVYFYQNDKCSIKLCAHFNPSICRQDNSILNDECWIFFKVLQSC